MSLVTDVDAITRRILTGSLCHGVSLKELLEAHIAPHPALTDAQSGCRVADDVDPRRRRKSVTRDSNLVFVPVVVSADTIEVSKAVTGDTHILAHILGNGSVDG